jgi:glycosyltransferase involved in cell wall biosynthesis
VSLKILHVLPGAHVGGAEQVGLLLAQAQRVAGHDARILTFSPGKVTESAAAMGIPVISGSASAAESQSKSVQRRGFAAAIQQTVSTFQPEIVHSHVPITHLMCNRVLPELRIPWVATLHGSWKQFAYSAQTLSRPWLRPYLMLRHAMGDRIATRSASKLIAVSEYTKRGLERIGISSARIQVIHNGLPPLLSPVPKEVARARMGISADDVVIGSLGYFAPVKGFDILIRAFSMIASRHSNVRLIIAGGGVMGESRTEIELKRLIAELRLDERVKLIGPVAPREGFLSALDIYVVSSRTEGFPLSLVEAMWHGQPSIVSSEGGNVEAARHGSEGLVFESGNVLSLADALEHLVSEPDLRASLGAAAQARASSYLTIERCAAEHEALFHALLKNPHESVTV